MATYNGARFLRPQLNSFAAQTRLPDELVISDDNSTDATADVIAEFSRTAPFPVRFEVNAQRLGFNRNFERAISRCAGEIVFVSDQDDEWFASKIATVMAAFEANSSAAAVVNDQVIASPDGRNTASTVLRNVRALGYGDDHFGPGCCTALRRPLLDVLAPFPGDAVPYDHWINIIPALLGVRIICETPLQNYRRHDSNATGSYFAQEGVSQGSIALRSVRTDVRDAYRARIAGNALIVARIADQRQRIVELGGGARIGVALRTLSEESEDYAKRLDCLARPRILRLLPILAMLRAGTYDRFRGHRSALKDFLTP